MWPCKYYLLWLCEITFEYAPKCCQGNSPVTVSVTLLDLHNIEGIPMFDLLFNLRLIFSASRWWEVSILVSGAHRVCTVQVIKCINYKEHVLCCDRVQHWAGVRAKLAICISINVVNCINQYCSSLRFKNSLETDLIKRTKIMHHHWYRIRKM